MADGSFFGNWFYDETNASGWHYNPTLSELDGKSVNQAYVDSTVRAFFNNLERRDLGGDAYDSEKGYMPGVNDSKAETGLLTSVGFSNKRFWTGLKYGSDAEKALVDAPDNGFYKRYDSSAHNEVYFERPIMRDEYKNRPMTRGFYDEAFDLDEQAMIVPKALAGYNGHRWPNTDKNASITSI